LSEVDLLVISQAGASRRIRHVVRRHRIPITLADQCLVSGVNFLSNILLVRFLGIEEFGVFTLAWMLVMFVNSLQYAAIAQPMLTIAPKRSEGETPAYYGAVITMELAMAAVAFVVILIAVEAAAVAMPAWGIDGLAIPLAVAQLSGQIQDFLRRYLFIRRRTFFAAVNDAIRYLGQLIVLYIVATGFSGGLTVNSALWIMAVTAMMGIGHGTLYLGTLAWSRLVLRDALTHHWRVARWLLPSALAYWATGHAFLITAGVLLGAATVGMLRAASAIVGVIHIIVMGMDNFAPAQASRIFHQHGSAALRQYLGILTWKISGLVLTIFLLMYLNAGTISRLMYGAEDPQLGLLLFGFSLCYLGVVLNKILGVWALAIESTEVVFISFAAATVFTAVVAYPLVFFGGVAGVIAGAFLSECIQGVILFATLRNKNPTAVT
jgi:O-antigen/teichoic acid export membrane protein